MLVVSARDSICRQLREALVVCGSQVYEAASSGDALAMLEAQIKDGGAFDILIIDFDLPDEHGCVLSQAVRARFKEPAIPIILLTRILDRRRIERMEDTGISGIISKPVKLGAFYGGLESLVLSIRDKRGISGKNIKAKALRDLGKGGKVLVVEDNTVNQKVACRLLEKFGLSWELAENGVKALEAHARNKYQLILMDCHMPEMDGFEATRCIREAEGANGERTPIVAITANAFKEDRDRCFDAGMDGYLSKPMRPRELESILQRFLM